MADLRERGKERGAAGRRQGRVRGSRQGQVSVTNGNHALPGQSPRVGVTSDGAENAPRLRVANGEDSQESKPPVKRRVRTHTACAQDSAPPVPWRWGSRTGNRRVPTGGVSGRGSGGLQGGCACPRGGMPSPRGRQGGPRKCHRPAPPRGSRW